MLKKAPYLMSNMTHIGPSEERGGFKKWEENGEGGFQAIGSEFKLTYEPSIIGNVGYGFACLWKKKNGKFVKEDVFRCKNEEGLMACECLYLRRMLQEK